MFGLVLPLLSSHVSGSKPAGITKKKFCSLGVAVQKLPALWWSMGFLPALLANKQLNDFVSRALAVNSMELVDMTKYSCQSLLLFVLVYIFFQIQQGLSGDVCTFVDLGSSRHHCHYFCQPHHFGARTEEEAHDEA